MEILIVSIVACAIALWIDYLIAREFYFAAQEKGYSGKKIPLDLLLPGHGWLSAGDRPAQPGERESGSK